MRTMNKEQQRRMSKKDGKLLCKNKAFDVQKYLAGTVFVYYPPLVA